jgi:acyl-coenzyme A synthetase/AMP-(fatty) acid ligase
LYGPAAALALGALATHSAFENLETLRGRSVLLATRAQLPTAVALLELDGIARRMTLCTPDLNSEQLAGVAAAAQADATVRDADVHMPPTAHAPARRPSERTEWVLLTSGTTGNPKLVVHDFNSLTGAVPRRQADEPTAVWSTFYDIRRYGGLQIYFRALLSGSALVLSSAGESPREFLARAAAAGVTHLSGTPSHWRSAMMSGDAGLLAPHYVRLSGEVADQTVLDNLRAVYPRAQVAHAFASTEGGVLFEVSDGLAGFPAEFLGRRLSEVELRVRDGTLWVRSPRLASRYLGDGAPPLRHADGYIDTGDVVEAEAGRYHFRGRHGGIINVGGLKVYPQEVESVLNEDPRVQVSLVKARRSPITGAVIVAEVVLREPAADAGLETLINELLDSCRRRLAPHKVPAVLRMVPALPMTSTGKLLRPDA